MGMTDGLLADLNWEFMGASQEKRIVLFQEFSSQAQVESVDESLKRIVMAWGSIVVPKRAIPGVGYQAHFRDPEGNVIGIIENDPLAQ